MEQTRQIKQFPFYDFYAEILNGLNDESAGRMAKQMCEYMFSKLPLAELTDGKERFYWGNLGDVLEESKEHLLNGTQLKGLNIDTEGNVYTVSEDITDQFNDAGHVIHISDSIDIPKPESASGGIAPTVDPWEEINHDVPIG